MSSNKLEKAQLRPINNEAETITFMFNPTQLKFARSVKWQSDDGNRGDSALPKVNFSGVDPYKLTLTQLVFDTYETGKSVVTEYLKKLKMGVESPDGKKKRPPVYVLNWGEKKSFPCVMLSLNYTLDMFLGDGTPVRAIVDITLQEVDKVNPPGDMSSSSQGSDRSGPESRQSRLNRSQGTLTTGNSNSASNFDF